MYWLMLIVLAGCSRAVPTQHHSALEASAVPWGQTGPIQLESVISARWEVPTSGVIDLTDPKAADLANDPFPIVLPVHVLTHPDHGVFVVDSGISEERAAGQRDVARGLVASFAKSIEPVESLAHILARQDAALAGVLITHTHLDHVMGLTDVPAGVPIYGGPGEGDAHGLTGHLIQPTVRRAFDERPLTVWDFDNAVALGPVPHALDVLGDGSLWALQTPGHTPGSTSYLAFTTEGPALFVGDTSHTRWGWDNAVPPGTYTEDHDMNRASLLMLRELVDQHPETTVFVGHEL